MQQLKDHAFQHRFHERAVCACACACVVCVLCGVCAYVHVCVHAGTRERECVKMFLSLFVHVTDVVFYEEKKFISRGSEEKVQAYKASPW